MLKEFLKSGHWPTLMCAFLYFDFCFTIWVLNGVMKPVIASYLNLDPVKDASVITWAVIQPSIIAGALFRFPLGLLSQYIGRKNAAFIEMGTIIIGLAYGWLFVDGITGVVVMGIILGIAGASFGVALSLGGGWYPPEYKGLAVGIAGAGNSGAVITMLLAPPIAAHYGKEGWKIVYGLFIMFMVVPIIFMALFAKEPPDREKKTLKGYLKVLLEKDSWIFNISYILTFGGYIGFTNQLTSLFVDTYKVSKDNMGQIPALIAIMASVSRIIGGWLADRIGGIYTMYIMTLLVVVSAIAASVIPANMWVMTAILIVLFLAMGAGNGATFQLVPLRWPTTTPIAMSMIGEVGALGAMLIGPAMAISMKNFSEKVDPTYGGSYMGGFVLWACIGVFVFGMYIYAHKHWSKTWVSKGGKAIKVSPSVNTAANVVK